MGWKLLFSSTILLFAFHVKGQPANCTFKSPAITIHFGTGNVRDANTESLGSYYRVSTSCPTDGHYSYAPSTSRCFSDDWHTLDEDHTPGDAGGNMLLVNASPYRGIFFTSTVGALKPNTLYEFGVWFMNLCKPTEKCPFPLLPNISIRIESDDGKVVASFNTGDIDRVESPQWSQHKAYFTTPAASTSLTLVMADNNPGGCGNDFAMDDLTFRECIKIPPPVTTTTKTTVPKTTTPKTAAPKTNPPKASTEKKPPATVKTTPKKTTPPPPPVKEAKVSQVTKPKADSTGKSISVIKQGRQVFPPPPLVLKTRENELVKRIEIDAGEIKVELYDNGEIDGDTVSIYHNNTLIKSHARLSQKPIAFTIPIDASQPHHELVMVAENLGSIPPNTSVMIITAGSERYQVFISSTETKNAKVIFDLKK